MVGKDWSVDATHSSSSDGYHDSATDTPNHLTSAVEARDESVFELNG